ncbi:galactoside O-acetyltransferase [Treponema primitia ZAS-2]|uniref:Galactoside O-acetyltransferase n=1 Tax=Treponema primitia (strain ATCC BAA-887 / DSM 12427 / ZAS-2) TaxID=545694 RepID=F5YQA7_TREPZ|nr:acyltransferase [Treponema primitia]AEF86982.1 galactoside O-acetyltransferase [Treponema primitia ZAS-2]
MFLLRRIYKKYKLNKVIHKNHRYIKIDETAMILPECTIEFRTQRKSQSIIIGNDSMINNNFIFESITGSIIIGERTFINSDTNLISINKIEIGNDVEIAWGCNIYDHNSHSFDWNNRHKDLFDMRNNYQQYGDFVRNKDWTTVKSAPIKINNKVWIGFGCTILNGVTIGEGAIIGAKSVVREDVEPWVVVAGNPAKIIKRIRK